MKMLEVLKDKLFYSGHIDDWDLLQSFQAVVSLETEEQDQPPDWWNKRIYIYLPTVDYPIQREGEAPGVDWLNLCSNLVVELLNNNYKTLVHCKVGENRSGLITVAALMKYEKISLSDALERVRGLNPRTLWNDTWVNLLHKYELFLHEESKKN